MDTDYRTIVLRRLTGNFVSNDTSMGIEMAEWIMKMHNGIIWVTKPHGSSNVSFLFIFEQDPDLPLHHVAPELFDTTTTVPAELLEKIDASLG